MFCIQCGSPNIAFRVPEGDNRPRHICNDCGHIHYTNPKIIVGTIPVFKDQILLCKRDIEPRKGYWNLPAGFLEDGESLMDGAQRELREEAIAKAQNLQLHTIYNVPHVSQMYFFFICELMNGQFGIGQETSDAKLFKFDEIPWQELAFSSNKFALENLDKHNLSAKPHFGEYSK